MFKDREKITKNMIALAALYAVIDILFAAFYMWAMVSENPRMEYYDASSDGYHVGYIFVRFLFALIPSTMIAVPAALLIFVIWLAALRSNRKIKYSSISLLVLGLIALRLMAITDCSPHRSFLDFGKADDGIKRTCGLSRDNPWVEDAEADMSR